MNCIQKYSDSLKFVSHALIHAVGDHRMCPKCREMIVFGNKDITGSDCLKAFNLVNEILEEENQRSKQKEHGHEYDI
jgi:hypothetical protein